MYDYIKGNITGKTNTSKGCFVTIETGGIGYLAEITARDLKTLALVYSVVPDVTNIPPTEEEKAQLFTVQEILATLNVGVPVTRLAKWKTAIQMMAITALLLAGRGSEYVYNEIMDIVEAEEFVRINLEGYIQKLGEIFLCISAVLTVITGYIYFKVGFKNF